MIWFDGKSFEKQCFLDASYLVGDSSSLIDVVGMNAGR